MQVGLELRTEGKLKNKIQSFNLTTNQAKHMRNGLKDVSLSFIIFLSKNKNKIWGKVQEKSLHFRNMLQAFLLDNMCKFKIKCL